MRSVFPRVRKTMRRYGNVVVSKVDGLLIRVGKAAYWSPRESLRKILVTLSIAGLLAFGIFRFVHSYVASAIFCLVLSGILVGRLDDYEARRYDYTWKQRTATVFWNLITLPFSWLICSIFFSFKPSAFLTFLVGSLIVLVPLGLFDMKRSKIRNRERARDVMDGYLRWTPFGGDFDFSRIFTHATRSAGLDPETLIREWLEVKMPTSRKLRLIDAGVRPENAFSPEVVSMTQDDVDTLISMRRLAAETVE